MECIIIGLILIFVFISGYFSVDRLTRFLDETREDMYGYPPLRGAAGREHGTNACCRNISSALAKFFMVLCHKRFHR